MFFYVFYFYFYKKYNCDFSCKKNSCVFSVLLACLLQKKWFKFYRKNTIKSISFYIPICSIINVVVLHFLFCIVFWIHQFTETEQNKPKKNYLRQINWVESLSILCFNLILFLNECFLLFLKEKQVKNMAPIDVFFKYRCDFAC